MPRELIWGNVITVRRGDLDVIRARTAGDLTALAASLPLYSPAEAAAVVNELRATDRDADGTQRELVRQLQVTHDALRALHADANRLQLEHQVLRRRHQLLSRFADEVDDLTAEDLVSSAALRVRLDRLRAALGPLEPGDPDVIAHGPSLPLDETAELALLREFAQDVGQVNAAADFPAIARSRLTPLVTQLAEALLELRERPAPEPVDDAAPLTDDAERDADDVAAARWAARFSQPARFRRDPGDPATSGPGWRTPAPDCPRRDYVHAGHRDPLPEGGLLDCPGLGPTFDAIRDYAAGHGPDPALDAPTDPTDPAAPTPSPTETVQLQLALVLSWVRDGGLVNVGVVGRDHATGREHDVGGFHLTLNWAAANKLIKKTRVARDQSHGAPE